MISQRRDVELLIVKRGTGNLVGVKLLKRCGPGLEFERKMDEAKK